MSVIFKNISILLRQHHEISFVVYYRSAFLHNCVRQILNKQIGLKFGTAFKIKWTLITYISKLRKRTRKGLRKGEEGRGGEREGEYQTVHNQSSKIKHNFENQKQCPQLHR